MAQGDVPISLEHELQAILYAELILRTPLQFSRPFREELKRCIIG